MNIKEMTIDEILFWIRQYSVERAKDSSSDEFYANRIEALCDEVKRRVSNA